MKLTDIKVGNIIKTPEHSYVVTGIDNDKGHITLLGLGGVEGAGLWFDDIVGLKNTKYPNTEITKVWGQVGDNIELLYDSQSKKQYFVDAGCSKEGSYLNWDGQNQKAFLGPKSADGWIKSIFTTQEYARLIEMNMIKDIFTPEVVE